MILQRFSDLDWKRKLIKGRVRKENHSYNETVRVVPMLFEVDTVLRDYVVREWVKGDVLFTGNRDKQLSPRQAHDGLAIYLRDTKFDGISWHCFRHTFVSICAAKNIPLDVIAEFTGHASADTLRLYRHLHPSDLRNRLSALFL